MCTLRLPLTGSVRGPKPLDRCQVPAGSGNTTRADSGTVGGLLRVGTGRVSASKIASATGARSAYREGYADTSTACAAAPGGRSRQPGTSSSPRGDPRFGPVGPPKNARAW